MAKKGHKLKISITGLGYIGPPHAATFAGCNYDVWGLDIPANQERIVDKLNAGIPTIEEPGLEGALKKCLERGNLRFTTDVAEAILPSYVHFFCVGTPENKDGSANTDYVFAAVEQTAKVLLEQGGTRDQPDLFVVKSTVPVFTNEKIDELLQGMGLENYHVVSCPEFMAESTAMRDLNNPHKVVIGVDHSRPHAEFAAETLRELYHPFCKDDKEKFIETDRRTAEMIKYACNSALGVKISFANGIANVCDAIGGDYHAVWLAMQKDTRIGGGFLKPGPGYGGMCFPKDLKAAASLADAVDVDMPVVKGAISQNQHQKLVGAYKTLAHFDGDLTDKVVGIWGLSFKARTDDIRKSAADPIMRQLLSAGAQEVKLYDVIDQARANFDAHYVKGLEGITMCTNPFDAANADAVILLTESKEYQGLDLDEVLGPRVELFVDMRNHLSSYQRKALAQRDPPVTYRGIGRFNT